VAACGHRHGLGCGDAQREDAAALDRDDPLGAFRDEFLIPIPRSSTSTATRSGARRAPPRPRSPTSSPAAGQAA